MENAKSQQIHMKSCGSTHKHGDIPSDVIIYIMPLQQIAGWYKHINDKWYGDFVTLETPDNFKGDYTEVIDLLLMQIQETVI